MANDSTNVDLTRAELADIRNLLRKVKLDEQQIDDSLIKALRGIVLRDQVWRYMGDFLKGWLPWIAIATTLLAFLKPSILTWLFGAA